MIDDARPPACDFVPTGPWPWTTRGVRVLPVLHGRLETARAVRALLDRDPPERVVVEIPAPLGEAWRSAVRALPRISAVAVDGHGPRRWLLVEPTDGIVEAGRWALERGIVPIAADVFVPDYPLIREATPDPAALPWLGYETFVAAWLEAGSAPRVQGDGSREQALAGAALAESAAGRSVTLVCGLAHMRGLLASLDCALPAREGVVPMRRPFRGRASVVPLHADSLGEVLSEPPFLGAAWERARRGAAPTRYVAPRPALAAAEVIPIGSGRRERQEREGQRAGRPDEPELPGATDPLARGELLWQLAAHAERHHAEQGGEPPSLPERRVLHRFARSMAMVSGHLHPDLFELVAAARGAVDDRFARDTHRVATFWPWPVQPESGARLTAAAFGADRRIVRLRPKIDRLARRPGLVRAWRREGPHLLSPAGLCSHAPEDIVVEALGDLLRETGAARAAGERRRSVPFTSSLLDGLDARETVRRHVVDGRPWVREEVRGRAGVGAVVVIFDPDDGEREAFPWREVWYGENENESDMALYATDPSSREIVPGIRRAEYGGFMMTWPPRRIGDVWHDPAYDALAATKPERLLISALDYAREPLVVHVARRPPRERMHALARRLGRRIVHLPPGALPRDRLRRVRTFHVLEGRHLRPIAEALVDPS